MKWLNALYLAAVCAVPGWASADDLTCVRDLGGKTIRWDQDWQADGVDNGVQYRVESATEERGLGQQTEVKLSLRALGPAEKPVRTAHVLREHVARLICDHIELTKQRSEALIARSGAERLADFRRSHQASIDALLNKPVTKAVEPNRRRYVAAVEKGDFDQAERILRESEAEMALHPVRFESADRH